MTEEVIFSSDSNHIARITLNRSQQNNALNTNMIQKIIDHLENLHESTTVRALVIQGHGDNFCSGVDLLWMKNMSDTTKIKNLEDAQRLSLLMNRLDTLPVPTIAYVHGAILGGGIGIISCCDIAIADSHSLFSFPEVKLGIVPAVISPYVLRSIGPRYARRYFLTGEKFEASIAYNMGLIHQIVDMDMATTEIDRILSYILLAGPRAIKRAKKLIREISEDVPEDLRRMTAELLADIRLSREGQEGLGAYLDKTVPSWVRK